MAISTETEALISYHRSKISNDIKQKSQIEQTRNGFSVDFPDGTVFSMPSIDSLLSWYDSPAEKIDKQIYNINVQIVGLQNTILSVGQSANLCGCGATTGIEPVGLANTTVVYADTVTYLGWSYGSPNPFQQTSGTLTSSNSGIGTEILTGITSIGVYYDDIGTPGPEFPLCIGVSDCTGYATSISNLQSRINELRSERNSLISTVNYLKNERAKYRIRKYGFDAQLEKLNEEINSSNSFISFLENPANEEWL